MQIRTYTKLNNVKKPSKMISRSMFKQALNRVTHNFTHIKQPPALQSQITSIQKDYISKRYYPGQGYRTVVHKNKGVDSKTATNKNLPQHETTHVNIIDKETGQSVGVYSSCKNPQKGFKKVSNDNYNGDKVNNNNPNSPPKAQYVKIYDNPKVLDEQTYEPHQNAQGFSDKHEKELDIIISEANKVKKIPVSRLHKDSPELYHENGLPIFDEKGNEIDYN